MPSPSLELCTSLLPFRLDAENKSVWRDGQEIFLRPKSVAVLHYLMERPGQIVTKRALLNAIWPRTYVTDGVLRASIRELRKALHDDARVPQVIETIHGRGYRLIAPPQPDCQDGQSSRFKVQGSKFKGNGSPLTLTPESSPPSCVGREAEIEQLTQLLDKAAQGERQVVFVTGEPGIGKTTVVDAFVDQIASRRGVWIAQGQCVAHYSPQVSERPVRHSASRKENLSDTYAFPCIC